MAEKKVNGDMEVWSAIRRKREKKENSKEPIKLRGVSNVSVFWF